MLCGICGGWILFGDFNMVYKCCDFNNGFFDYSECGDIGRKCFCDCGIDKDWCIEIYGK